jgi:hypothetical protein
MARGSQKTGFGVIVLFMLAGPAAALDFPARHNHWRKGCAGILTLDADGAGFRQIGAKKEPHAWRWTWADIQRLEIGDDRRVRVRTYRDSRLRLGADIEYEFLLDGRPDLVPVYELLRTATDARFVARLAAPGAKLEWELPAKRVRGTGGALGVLCVYEDRVVFAADRPGESRTWRDSDIALVSSSGPLHFSLTAAGAGEIFEFRLRRSLEPERYERLWLRLEAPRGVKLLNEEKETTR